MRLIDADAIHYTMLYKENWIKGNGVEAQAVWKSDIDALPTIDQRWVPCSERLPMQGTEVLACDKDGFLSIAEYEWIDGEIWWRETTEYRHIEDAIAWMFLPEPYKGEEG